MQVPVELIVTLEPGERTLLGEHRVDDLDSGVAVGGEQATQLGADRTYGGQLGGVTVVAPGEAVGLVELVEVLDGAHRVGLETAVGQLGRGLEGQLYVMGEYHVDRLPQVV